jgi:protein-disulfide isomerase
MKKVTGAILFLFFAMTSVFSQSAKPAEKAAPSRPELAARTPTATEVETALKRTLGYDPAITWKIYDVRPSVVPGLFDAIVSLNNQPPQHIYMAAGEQLAIIGEMIPFGPNPYASSRAKLEAADGPSSGSQTPVISIVEFSDLECPHCKVAQPILEKLIGDFPQARYTFQHFPLPASMHPWAMKAAEYADCVSRANPSIFWKYIDTIFENQGSIALATADDQLKGFATTLGLDAQKISACAALPQTEARIKKSMDIGQSLDVTQTPTVFINGRRVLSIADIPYDQLKNLVQFEISHAGQ